MDDLLSTSTELLAESADRTVVRLRRSWWHDKKGACQRLELRFLARSSTGFNLFHDDCCQVGAESALKRIINLEECEDGIYELLSCNTRTDWETGYVDEWDYKLVPFTTAS